MLPSITKLYPQTLLTHFHVLAHIGIVNARIYKSFAAQFESSIPSYLNELMDYVPTIPLVTTALRDKMKAITQVRLSFCLC